MFIYKSFVLHLGKSENKFNLICKAFFDVKTKTKTLK